MRGAKVATQSEYDTEGGGAGGDGDDDDGDSGGADTFNVADLVPRTDIRWQPNLIRCPLLKFGYGSVVWSAAFAALFICIAANDDWFIRGKVDMY